MKIWRSRTINEVHSEEKSQVILGSLVLLLFAGILFMRSFYSFSWSDESLYMAEVHRLYLGERPFVDEWHPTQFYAVLLLPFYRVYVWIKGTTEGIYFASRIFNLLLAFMAAESTYYVLKKYFELENWLSVAGGTIILLYSRANVGGISYHNFFFFCFIIAEMLLYIGIQCHRAKKNSLVFVVLSGISGAVGGAAMIAIPTCVFGVGIIYISIIIYAIKTKTIKKFTPIWIHIAGILLLGTMYCIFVFSKITFIDFINMFQYLFMDESHQRKGIVDVMNNVWWVVIFYGKNVLVVAGLLFIMKIILRLFHKATDEKLKAVAYVIVVMIGTLSLYRLSDSHMSAYVIFAFTGIGLLIIDESITKNIFFTGSDINFFLLIPALVIALTFILASATIDPAYGGGHFWGWLIC